MTTGNIDERHHQAEQAFSEHKYRNAFDLILKILDEDFTYEPAWQLLHKALGKQQSMDEFKITIAEKYFPDKVALLLEKELKLAAAERLVVTPYPPSSAVPPSTVTRPPNVSDTAPQKLAQAENAQQSSRASNPAGVPSAKPVDRYINLALITGGVLLLLLFILPTLVWPVLLLLLGWAAFFSWKLELLPINIRNQINVRIGQPTISTPTAQNINIELILRSVFAKRMTYIIMAGVGVILILVGVNALTESGILRSNAWMESVSVSASQYRANRAMEQRLHGQGIFQCILGSVLLLVGLIGGVMRTFVKHGEAPTK